MIYYFSGTGNSRWAAEKLAEYTGDVCRSISETEGRKRYRIEEYLQKRG